MSETEETKEELTGEEKRDEEREKKYELVRKQLQRIQRENRNRFMPFPRLSKRPRRIIS